MIFFSVVDGLMICDKFKESCNIYPSEEGHNIYHWNATGPVRGLGVLGREHFEINPEEIHVTFADVKGVSI